MGYDWLAWHADYADPSTRIAQRLPVVQAHIRRALAVYRGRDVRLVSFCSGAGHDVLPVLAAHPERERVRARLVELDPRLAAQARAAAAVHGLDQVEVVTGDAGRASAYAGAVPADIVLVCGVFGNISDADVERTVRALPGFCAAGASVVWTRHRSAPDLTPRIRAWFADSGFTEQRFDSGGPGSYAVGSHLLHGRPQPLPGEQPLFRFVR